MRNTRRFLSAAAALAAVLICGAAADAATAAKNKKPHVDLSGFWTLSGRTPPDKALMDKLPPNTAVLEDTGAPELPIGDYGGLKVRPKALEAAKKWNPKDDMTISKACEMPSIVYATQGPFPMEIFQGTEFIIFKMEYFDMMRVVFMDGRPHPGAEFPHSKLGHSIGHWEGDTLVVDTTHLKASTITNNGLNHTDNIHVIEHFKLSPDGKTLLSTQEFEDPEVLDNRGARFIAWRLVPGQHVNPYECDPAYIQNYLN